MATVMARAPKSSTALGRGWPLAAVRRSAWTPTWATISTRSRTRRGAAVLCFDLFCSIGALPDAVPALHGLRAVPWRSASVPHRRSPPPVFTGQHEAQRVAHRRFPRIDNTETKCLEYRENFMTHSFLWTDSVGIPAIVLANLKPALIVHVHAGLQRYFSQQTLYSVARSLHLR